MAEKKKQKPSPPPASRRTDTKSATVPGDGFDKALKHPTFVVGCICLLITLFAAGAAIRFHNDMSMGVIGEPTGVILWGAVTFTLFMSYRRELKSGRKSDS